MIKAIIFDCFGVMVSDAFSILVDKMQLSRDQIEKVAYLIDQGNKGIIKPEEYRAEAAQIVGVTPEEYQAIMRNNIKNDALLDYALKLRKNYKVAMLSNISGMSSLESRFDKGELQTHFDVVIASADIGYAKPEAQAYEITTDRLGVRLDECVMIDDRLPYCEGATGVGIKTILYTDFESMKHELESLLNTPSNSSTE